MDRPELRVKVWSADGSETVVSVRMPDTKRILRAAQAYRRRTPGRLPGQSELLALALVSERAEHAIHEAKWLIARDGARRLRAALESLLAVLEPAPGVVAGGLVQLRPLIGDARDTLRALEEREEGR